MPFVDTKSIFASKTFWLNLVTTLVAVLTLVAGQEWIAEYPKVTAAIGAVLGLLNIVLRFISVDAVKLFTLLLAVTCAPSVAEACHRCGRSPCRFVSHVVAAPVVQQVVQSPDVFVVQNNYPQPLVAQGSVGYTSTGVQGYQAATIPLLDPNQYFSQELQLLRAASDANALRSERSAALFQRVAELNAPVAERLAAGQAASMVLQAAGLDPSNKSAALQSSAVVIRRDGSGGVQVQQLTQSQVESLTQKSTAPPAPPPPILEAAPTLSKFCAQCHGTYLAAPKGGFFLGDDDNVAKSMREKFFSITRHVSKGTMPPADSPQPTQEERAAILNEIESIIISRGVSP